MFPCTQCGCCCKRVGNLVNNTFLKIMMDGIDGFFPYTWDETGKCEMLGDDNKCKVYDDRPLICRIDELGEAFMTDKKEWYKSNIRSCNTMMDEDGIDQSLRIKILK